MDKEYNKDQVAKVAGILFLTCAILFLVLLFWTNQRVMAIDVTNCERKEPEGLTYNIDMIRYEYDYVFIKGHAYEKGETIDTANISLLACNEDTDTYRKLPTENVKMESLTKKADDGFNYDYGAFRCVVYRNKVSAGERLYILYRCNGKDILIRTDEILE